MFNTQLKQQLAACQQQLAESQARREAVDRSMAVIEFQPDGTIVTANDNFLATMGYRLEEIHGQHHRLFCQPGYAASAEYQRFWQRLASGEFIRERFLRLNKAGQQVCWKPATTRCATPAGG